MIYIIYIATNECDYCERCNLQYTKDKQCPSGMYCEASCGTNTLYGCCKYMDKSSSTQENQVRVNGEIKFEQQETIGSGNKKSWTNEISIFI